MDREANPLPPAPLVGDDSETLSKSDALAVPGISLVKRNKKKYVELKSLPLHVTVSQKG